MFEGVKRKIAEWRRKRRLKRIRREFARCGYPLDHLDDSGVAAALTGGKTRIEEVPLTAKTIYFALRRLTAAGEGGGAAHFPKRGKTVRAVQNA